MSHISSIIFTIIESDLNFLSFMLYQELDFGLGPSAGTILSLAEPVEPTYKSSLLPSLALTVIKKPYLALKKLVGFSKLLARVLSVMTLSSVSSTLGPDFWVGVEVGYQFGDMAKTKNI